MIRAANPAAPAQVKALPHRACDTRTRSVGCVVSRTEPRTTRTDMLAIADDDTDIELDQDTDTPQRTTRELECVLNDTEVRERGQAMATAERDADRLKTRRKNLNAQIRSLTDRMSELAQAIEQRRETREVPCTWTPDYQRRTWTLTRDDTNEALEQRAMNQADLQTRLPGVDLVDGDDAPDDDGDLLPDDAPDDDGAPVDQSAAYLDARSTPADAAVLNRARARNTAPARPKAKSKSPAAKTKRAAKSNKRGR